MTKHRRVYRDAGTGNWVSPEYAKEHPETTVGETYDPIEHGAVEPEHIETVDDHEAG